MINEDYEDEIKKCWEVQDGLKTVMDDAIEKLNNPDTQKSEYLKMRKETVYPSVAAGLAKCPNASAAWNSISDAIDKCDDAMKEDLWDHCYIKCPHEQAMATRYWKLHAYWHAGEAWA